jgi:Undecaprenyl-phosphate galactose phosphotransferase WbaP
VRVAPRSRPHLVSTTEIRVQPERAVEAGVDSEGVELSRGSFNFSEAPARPIARSRAPTFEPTGSAAVAKRFVDVIGSVVLGLVFSPLIIVIVFLMRRKAGSVLYRHRRVGRGGQMFSCLKFRTMVPNADQALRELLESNPELQAEWVRDHKLRNDPRVTRLGRFLRRTSLDELPQLLNVLSGEMSLVGPRPVVREELLRYGRSVGTYLTVKPGITGLWQVTGRNNTDYRRRVVLDTYYVRNQNLLLDLYILAKTTGVVLGGKGAY